MKVILKNHSEQYAAREIINSFFPKTKIDFVNEIPSNEDYVYSEIQISNNQYTYISVCEYKSKKSSSTLTSNVLSKNKIKKSISDCLKELTGITLPWGLLTGIRPAKIVREFLSNNNTNSISAVDYLKNEYEVIPSKAKLAATIEKKESKFINTMNPYGISIYVGIPFCPTRCLYCSFTSQSIAYSNKLTQPYTEALIKEIIEISKTDYVNNHIIESVYFGGGTPTALSTEQINMILYTMYNNFDLSHVKEFTFEAGRPDTITQEKLLLLKKYGITRISINPQTINDKTLKIIGRNHSSEDFKASFNLARELGFEHINCDIIAGLPEENISDFINTLNTLYELNPESITVHTMCIKHGSFLDSKYDMFSLTAANTVNEMLEKASETAKKLNMSPYYIYRQKNMLGNLENVGYCKDAHECLYNIYIMEEVQSIIALGGGASTKIIDNNNIERSFNVKEVSEYINRIDEMINRKIEFLSHYSSTV